jgi:DNA-binding MarR family transcriptional regulator
MSSLHPPRGRLKISSIFEEIAGLDRLVHEPSRLAILTALSACQSADFLFLQNLTGLTGGNLSSHIHKLEDAGLVQTEKQFVDRRPNTQVQITSAGRSAIQTHWEQLETLHENAQTWKPES